MPKGQAISVPTMRSMGSAFGDFGVGLAGGAIYHLARGFLGSGILGAILAPIAAGSILKGTRGQVISTIAGYTAAEELIGGILGGLGSGGSNTETVM